MLKFKVKDGYKLKLQSPETMKLFGCSKDLIDKKKKKKIRWKCTESWSSFSFSLVVLVQSSLVDNQYQQK